MNFLLTPFGKCFCNIRSFPQAFHLTSCQEATELLFNWLPSGSEGKTSACNVGDLGSIPGLGSSPGEGNGNPLQYSCLENPKNGGAWYATVHGVIKSWTRLSDFTFTFTFRKNQGIILGVSQKKNYFRSF